MSKPLGHEQEIEEKELMYSIASMILSVGVLTLPRNIAATTRYSDGWMSIVLAGTIAVALVWILSTLAASFPKQSYFEFISRIASRPVGYMLTGLFSFSYLLFTAFELRSVADVTKHYLFDKTPIEFIGLAFMLVVIYAVYGSRVGLLRLNMLFFPIVGAVLTLSLLLNVGVVDVNHFKPMFVTDWKGIMKGAQASGFSFLGFEIVLMYAMLMKNPQRTVKAAVKGTMIPFATYIVLYIFTIGVLSYRNTAELAFPTVEFAKEAEVPGAFFERFESLFFTIWIMTIFNTTAMSLDVCMLSLKSIVPKASKMTKLLVLSPLIYLISFVPQDNSELNSFGTVISFFHFMCCIMLPAFIFIAAKWRKVKPDG
ncbi:GerAB/ArcD/ProY family transporter [Paenibacillus piri]|uniref:Spore gernimation protein n=1 Tax=Paenibacillus piri TaxID=2547395 RepID=A0A4V2ZSR2_9BACL|nr:endospore germination permease [Paenibacillus piri]TDF94114.1 spore gernimation protein [Paenibacillus piri]